MPNLRFISPQDDATLADWQHVHNTIIPTDPLSLDVLRERRRRYRLEVAYVDDVAVGCSTVRPPDDETPNVTVIARILPPHRRQGLGRLLYARCLDVAATLGGAGIETVVLASNTEGLAFARALGFEEVETYLLDGATIPYVALALPGRGCAA
ncbi:GNAT family N-acetyltransferase [Streptomyces sp. NBC_00536]|uniref:GNAT family N-acetyltransferase n=1 Tax=Streptomyces sp. NBC_00536 TaxID=2975769 RepID=UPI002E8027E0|nr:GNAT family N-acetyltransferase [Streptomyces sp. NBC_00536]WUC79659.1 GNAT family N-acetyltransferase [Streptomyces sp. NBC_00536]